MCPCRRAGLAELLQRGLLRGRQQRLRPELGLGRVDVLPRKVYRLLRRQVLRGELRLQPRDEPIRLLCASSPGIPCVFSSSGRQSIKAGQAMPGVGQAASGRHQHQLRACAAVCPAQQDKCAYGGADGTR